MGQNNSKPIDPIVFEPPVSIEVLSLQSARIILTRFTLQLSPNLLRKLDGDSTNPESADERFEREMSKLLTRKTIFEGQSADATRREVEDLIRRMRPAAPIIINKEAELKQDNIIKCYLENPNKPLDCWKEVEVFRQVAIKTEQGLLQ
ncbi:hypothetical protein HK098_003824 [Nowakowskiella sp. JEL0407]|nr:hypothetical protein HK098_003824 [Nowakowskiella sp. JEL0407]